MEARRKVADEMSFGAGKYLSTLARIMYAPQDEIKEEVDAARERIKQLGIQHCPPQTDDENLVALYDAVTPRTLQN